MGGRSTIALAVLVTAVGAYLWFSDTRMTQADRPGPTGERPPAAESAQALPKLLVFEPAAVTELQLKRAGQIVTAQRQDGDWQVTESASAINDFLHTLATLGVLADIPASAQELAQYGLDPPLAGISLRVSGQAAPLVLHIGERNPAITGVYVRLGDNGSVVLAGALVEWEFDKLFKRLSPGS